MAEVTKIKTTSGEAYGLNDAGHFALNNLSSTAITSGQDMNDLKKNGNYVCAGGTIAATLLNCPYTAGAFWMVVYSSASGTFGNQLLFARDGQVFTRALTSGGTWQRWYSLSDGADGYKFVRIIAQDESLDEILDNGIYYYPTYTGGMPSNAPMAWGGILEVYGNNGNQVVQRFTGYGSNNAQSMARRAHVGGAWLNWVYDYGASREMGAKRLSIVGDSISSFAGYVPSGQHAFYSASTGDVNAAGVTWWHSLATRLGAGLGVINSDSGSACAYGWRNSAAGGSRISACDPARTGNLGNADAIVVFIGTNDYISADNADYGNGITLGDWHPGMAIPSSHTACTDFSTSYAFMLKGIQKSNPNSRIYCCTLPWQGSESGKPAIDEHVAKCGGVNVTKRKAEWNDRIREIAKAFHCEVIEFAECGFNHGNYFDKYAYSGVHPNAAGHRLLMLEALRHFD